MGGRPDLHVYELCAMLECVYSFNSLRSKSELA